MKNRIPVFLCLFLFYGISTTAQQSISSFYPADFDGYKPPVIPENRTTHMALYGTVEANKTVQLKWEAVIDGNFSHFLIEYSKNGAQFKELARISGQPPYIFSDDRAISGEHYYRVILIGKDGSAITEGNIKVKVQAAYSILLYANEQKQEVVIDLLATMSEQFAVELLTEDDIVLQTQKMDVARGNNRLHLPIHELQAGTYLVKVSNSKGEIIESMKLLR